MNEETLTCGRCKTPYEIDEEHVIFKKGKMAYIRCSFCNQVRRIAWNVVEHLKPSVKQEKHVISEHVKPLEHVKNPVKSSTEESKMAPPSESSKKEKISESHSDFSGKIREKGENRGEIPSPQHSDFSGKEGEKGEKDKEQPLEDVVQRLTKQGKPGDKWEKLREIEGEATGEKGENRGETPSPQHSEISGKEREKGENGKGGSIWRWVAAGVGSLIAIGVGIALGGRRK